MYNRLPGTMLLFAAYARMNIGFQLRSRSLERYRWPCRKSQIIQSGANRWPGCCVECGYEANADLVAAINV